MNQISIIRPFYLLFKKIGIAASIRKWVFNYCFKNHGLMIHKVRLKLVQKHLPPGKKILDLGGANAPLYDMGYPHNFEHLLMIDLPPDQRHHLHRKTPEKIKPELKNKVEVLYCDMTELSPLADQSYDFVFSGESIEHISQEQAKKMCKEVMRVLKPGGYFCLDTPNRIITKIHTAPVGGGYIHPEHQWEYTPSELRKLLQDSGFVIEEEFGVCHMPLTKRTGVFKYEDFLFGSGFHSDIDGSYIQYFKCKKA